MKILIPADRFGNVLHGGGVGWSSYYLAKALAEDGYDVDVIVPFENTKGVGRPFRKIDNVKVTYFGYKKGLLPVLKNRNVNEIFWKDFGNFLENYLSHNKVDIIHAQHQMTIIPSIIAGKKHGIPVVSHLRNYWPVCYFGTLGFGEKHDCKACVARHFPFAAVPGSPVMRYVRKNLEYKKKVLLQSDRIISIGMFMQELLGREGIHSEYVPNFVDIDDLKGADVEINEPFMLYIGNLTEEKGASFLLQALDRLGTIEALHNPLKTIVVGNGHLERKMKSFIEKRRLNVQLIGRISHEKVIGLTMKSEAVLFPSLWPEPFGRVIIESMALGKTVIATDFGEPSRIIRNNYDGVLAKRTPEDFSDKISAVLNSGSSKRIGMNAKSSVRKRFNKDRALRKIKKVYDGL